MEPNATPPSLRDRLIIVSLASWRFILLLLTPPLVTALWLIPAGVPKAAMLGLSGWVGFNCWRLWLDGAYFFALQQTNADDSRMGEDLAFIWHRKGLCLLNHTQRQQGAISILHRTLLLLGILWLLLVLNSLNIL